MRKSVDVLCITLSSPVLVGVYEDGRLIEEIASGEKSSEILPVIFEKLLQKYELSSLFYANGPGSFMAIKVAYIFLKSLSILKKIPLYATDAFAFNQNQPIKAIGKLYFVKIHDNIETQKLDEAPTASFALPKRLERDIFNTDTPPLYKIGAIG